MDELATPSLSQEFPTPRFSQEAEFSINSLLDVSENQLYYILTMVARVMECNRCYGMIRRIDPMMMICEDCWLKIKDDGSI